MKKKQQFNNIANDVKISSEVEFAGSNASFRGAYVNVQAEDKADVEEIAEGYEDWDVTESPRESQGNWRIHTGPP